MKTQVKINSIDVTSYLISWLYERTFGEALSEISLKFNRNLNNALTVSTGLTLEVYRGWIVATEEKIFSGYIEKYEPESGIITITGIDKMWDLVRKEVTHVYDYSIDASAGKISEIFKDLVTTYGGLTADGTTIQDSGTTYIIQKFVCNHTDPMERCKKLAEILNWQFYYRADTDKVYFEPKGYSTNPNTLTVGNNIINLPKWQNDITEMTNDVTIVGAYQEVETTKSGRIGTTSGFTNFSIALDYEPISVKVYGDASNPPTTLKTGGMPDSTVTYDYYVDKGQKKIFPKTTFTTNDYYEVRYSLAAPIPINMYNQISIDSYGRFTKTITYNDIRSVSDAENRGTNYLTQYSYPFVYTTLKIKDISTNPIAVGQNILVIDNISKPVVNSLLLINRLRLQWPTSYDEIDVGDKYWRLSRWQADVMEKLKRIEEDEFANLDQINKLIDVSNTTSPIKIDNRYSSITTETAAGTNIFILGNNLFDVLGTNRLGATGVTSASSWIAQGKNTYTETFYDNDFKDASTTATWNTTTKQLTFTAGQLAQSTSIDYNNGTITTATLTATVSSGTFTYYLSADGGVHFETVSNGVAFTFVNTGTNLKWKITESGASTGTITKVVISNYH